MSPPTRTHPGLPRRAARFAGGALFALGLCIALPEFGPFIALAAPLPPARRAPEPLAPLAPARNPGRATTATTALDRACGSQIDELPGAYAAMAEHFAAGTGALLPTPHSTDVGEIAVLEDDGTFFYVDKGGNVNLDVAAAGRAFYRTHGDDYDQLSLWLTTGLSNWLGSPTALAAAWLTHNSTAGIGLDFFDYNASLGLPPRVQCVLTMNGLQRYPADPAAEVVGLPNYVTQDVLAHEFGHEWLAYPWIDTPEGQSPALLGRSYQHWSFFFDSDGSVMEGPDWLKVPADSFVSLPPIARFGKVDQYLMGVRPREEVDSFFVVADTAVFTPPGPYLPVSNPNVGINARGPARRFAIDDIEAVNGPRMPDATLAPHALRMAFVLIVPNGSAASAADLAKLETIRAAFPGTVSGYTGGRMSLDATLDSHAGRLRIVHAPLHDFETPGLARKVSVRVVVDQAGIPIGVNPAGVSVWWRTDPALLWNQIPMVAAAPDSFSAQLPGEPSGTRLEYWFRAESDSAGLRTDTPELSRSRPYGYEIGPDATPPAIVHWAQHAQSSDRLPQILLARVTDNLAVDSVWCEFSQDGGPQQSLAAQAAGVDSFVVSLGAGAPRGARIAYRFAARDRAVAHNIGYSNPAFDTLRVGHDWVDEFWNPGPWTHANVRFNRRDEWRPCETPAFPSGSTAWHCGSDSLPYGPYQDAALTGALVYDITAGTLLTFAHRYDLEDVAGDQAFDGARVEIQTFNGPWAVATPVVPYTHSMAITDQGFPQHSPCWSGRQDEWRQETIDLSAYAPGPVRVRFQMSTDTFVGRGGWWVDQVRVHFPDQSNVGVAPGHAGGIELGPTWPNPARGAVHQALRLPSAANVEWALHDLAGRRVATLWRGPLTPGAHELVGALPHALPGGLYFSRVSVDGRTLPAHRVALVR